MCVARSIVFLVWLQGLVVACGSRTPFFSFSQPWTIFHVDRRLSAEIGKSIGTKQPPARLRFSPWRTLSAASATSSIIMDSKKMEPIDGIASSDDVTSKKMSLSATNFNVNKSGNSGFTLMKLKKNFMEFEGGLQTFVIDSVQSVGLLWKRQTKGLQSLTYDEYQKLQNAQADLFRLSSIGFQMKFYSSYFAIFKFAIPFATSLIKGQNPSTWRDFPLAFTSKTNQEVLKEIAFETKFPSLISSFVEYKIMCLNAIASGDRTIQAPLEKGLDVIERSFRLLERTKSTDSEQEENCRIQKTLESLEPFYTYVKRSKDTKQRRSNKLLVKGLPSPIVAKIVKYLGGSPYGDWPILRSLNHATMNQRINQLRDEDDVISAVGVNALTSEQTKNACLLR